MREYGSIIGGKEIFSGDWIEVKNPYTGKVVGKVNSLPPAEIEKAMQTTHDATMTLSRYERHQILNKMADAIDERVEEISLMITDESGLSLADTMYEASRVADVLRFSAIRTYDDDSQVFPCDISKNGRQRRVYTTRIPLKLIACITPFNHPMNQVVHKIAPAIATNNTVILKPSEKTPLSSYYLAKLALDCGLPPHMLNVVNGPVKETCDLLVRSEVVSMISFTGSTEIGKDIANHCGYKKIVIELGGSSALIVCPDANVDEAVEITMGGLFKNSAQRCTAIRRLIVHESIADEYAAKLTEKASKLKYGNPYDPNNDMGTVISEESAILMEDRVNATIAAGAKLLLGNKRQNAVFSPTVLDFVQNNHAVVCEETFGPVAPIIRYSTLDEAIEIANDTAYGLSGGVVSNHWPTIQRVINELETGTINVNEAPSYRIEWTPFGGIKDSGLGYKEGVIETMKAYTNVKTYSLPWDTP